jgi:hypothetical protein
MPKVMSFRRGYSSGPFETAEDPLSAGHRPQIGGIEIYFPTTRTSNFPASAVDRKS